MRKLFAIFLAGLLSASAFAQAPQKMSYQVVIRNSSDQLVNTQAVGMQISILRGTETGTEVYVEKHTPTTNENGLVSIEIGGGTAVTGNFANINWASGTYFIKTEIDPEGLTNYTITGVNQILSVPYALNAKKAETATNVVYENKFLYLIRFDDEIGDPIKYEYWAAKNDGTGEQKITFPVSVDESFDGIYFGLTSDRKTILYINELDDESIYSVSIDGTNNIKIIDAPAPLVAGGSVSLYIIATY